MFTFLFMSILPFFALLIGLYLVYYIFLADYFEERRMKRKEQEEEKDKYNKIAKLKCHCNDVKEIENFVQAHAQHLSEESIKQLVARVEALKLDEFIYTDSSPPLRVKPNLVEEEFEESNEKAVMRR